MYDFIQQNLAQLLILVASGGAACWSVSSRFKSKLEALNIANDTIARQRETIDRTDRTIDEKTVQIRSLTQKLWEAEQEVNRVNERNHEQAGRIARLMLENEHWKHWHCRRCDCQDPRGREPSQDPPETSYTPYQHPEEI